MITATGPRLVTAAGIPKEVCGWWVGIVAVSLHMLLSLCLLSMPPYSYSLPIRSL